MEEGDRVRILVPGSRFNDRLGTIRVAKPRKRSHRWDYRVEVDGDEGTPWGELLPAFERHELVPIPTPEEEE